MKLTGALNVRVTWCVFLIELSLWKVMEWHIFFNSHIKPLQMNFILVLIFWGIFNAWNASSSIVSRSLNVYLFNPLVKNNVFIRLKILGSTCQWPNFVTYVSCMILFVHISLQNSQMTSSKWNLSLFCVLPAIAFMTCLDSSTSCYDTLWCLQNASKHKQSSIKRMLPM